MRLRIFVFPAAGTLVWRRVETPFDHLTGEPKMRYLTTVFLAGLMVVATESASRATLYDAFADFSSTTNGSPNPWSYGDGTTGTSFTPYIAFSPSGVCNAGGILSGIACWNTSNNHEPSIGINTTASTLSGGTVILPTGVLYAHPGPSTDTILRFTAPSAGTYAISGTFEILDTSPTGVIGLVELNGLNVYSGTLAGPGASGGSPGGSESFYFVTALSAGDVIDIGVNNDGNYLFDSTGLTVDISATSVPEPSSLAIFVVGLICLASLGMSWPRYRSNWALRDYD